MPYLTPDELPETYDCRSLAIPASSDWLALVTGALTELTKTWNWEQHGTLTVDQCVTAMETMIAAYYAGCSACTLPGGYKATRINASGHLETLSDSGEWEAATGDYAYPAITAREGGTAEDQICLAATNAANVLSLAYEQITEAYASELSAAEALTTLIEWFIIAVGGEAAPFAFAIALFLIPVFILAYEALDYLTADLWDDNFTQQFVCMLVGCATNVDGVVTFDWDCVEHALYAGTYRDGFSELQLRLYIQINFILWVLGGVDALNVAGATTGISSAVCLGCGQWCYPLNFREDDYDLALSSLNGGTWIAGEGWRTTNTSVSGTRTLLQGTLTLPSGITIDKAAIVYDWTRSGCTSCSTSGSLWGYGTTDPYEHNMSEGNPCTTAQGTDLVQHLEVADTINKIVIDFQTSFTCYGGEATVHHINLFGTDVSSYEALVAAYGDAVCE